MMSNYYQQYVTGYIVLSNQTSRYKSKRIRIVTRESPPPFENQIMAWVYVRGIMRSTMCQNAPFCSPEISSVARGFSRVKIDYSDYSKSFISRINEVQGFP